MLIGNIYERSWHFFGISNWGMMALFFLSWDIPSSHRWQVLSSTQAFEILAEFNVQDEYATEATTTVIIHTRSFGLKADVDGLVWGAYFCLLSRFVADKKTYIYLVPLGHLFWGKDHISYMVHIWMPKYAPLLKIRFFGFCRILGVAPSPLTLPIFLAFSLSSPLQTLLPRVQGPSRCNTDGVSLIKIQMLLFWTDSVEKKSYITSPRMHQDPANHGLICKIHPDK